MQIKVNLKIFIFIIIFCITKQIEIYGILMLFALFHELGHLFLGFMLGFKPKSLNINPVGLSINFAVEVNDYNKKVKNGNILALKKILIALAGPLVNFIIAIIFYIFKIEFFHFSREFIIYSNILIGIFNLIPIYPLDGGRILKNLIHIKKGLQDSYKYINMISNITIIILSVLTSFIIIVIKNISIIIIIGYLWCLVINNNKQYYQREKMYSLINSVWNN